MMQTGPDNIVIVKQIEECFKKGNFDCVLKWLAQDDVIWEVYGSDDYPFAGKYCGIEQVAQLFNSLAQVTEFKLYEVEELIPHHNQVVVSGCTEVQWFGGHIFKTKWLQLFTLHNGKVIAFREARG